MTCTQMCRGYLARSGSTTSSSASIKSDNSMNTSIPFKDEGTEM